MASAPQHGDPVPAGLRQELLDLIGEGKTDVSRVVLAQALAYGTAHLGMAASDADEIWDYVAGRLSAGSPLCYANLDDYPDRWGYAMRKADGANLYIKLSFNDRGRVVLLSFHG
jgi:hypothetical protein